MSWEGIIRSLGNFAYFLSIIIILVWVISMFLAITELVVINSFCVFLKKNTRNREILLTNGIDLNLWDNFLFLKYVLIKLLFRNWCINSNWIIAFFSYCLSSALVFLVFYTVEGLIISNLIFLFPMIFDLIATLCKFKLLWMFPKSSHFFQSFHELNKLKLDDQLAMFNKQIDGIDFDELANLITLNLINKKDVPNLLTKKLIKCKQRITKFRNSSGKITLKQVRNLKVDLMTNYFIVIIEMCRLQKNEALPFATNGNDTYTWTQLTSKINRCFFTEYSF